MNSVSVRDGVNCDTSTVFINVDLEEQRCSHMIDDIFKYGLVVSYPFDDPVSLYGIMSSMTSGLPEEHPDLQTSYDVANVIHAGIGNLESGIKYAARLGGGLQSASPTFVPSTAPIIGARNDFEYYARNSYHQILLRIMCVRKSIHKIFSKSLICDYFSGTWTLVSTGLTHSIPPRIRMSLNHAILSCVLIVCATYFEYR